MFEILKKERLTELNYRYVIYAPYVAKKCEPGQFLIVIDKEKGERIPLTICDFNRQNGEITIVFQVVGDSTQGFSKMNEGDAFRDVVGPLGKASEIVMQPNKYKDKSILWIAGGLGTAPVYPQAKWAKNHNIRHDVIIGCKNYSALIYEKEMKEVCDDLYICTDDGSYGFKGLVTECLEKLVNEEHKHYDIVVAIGPLVMMKYVSKLTEKLNIPTIVSLNTIMVDGTGMCGACRVDIDGKMKFACVDGPEFDGHKVDFDNAIQRSKIYPKHKIALNTANHHCNLADAIDGTLKEENKSAQYCSESVNKFHRVKMREIEPNIRNKNFEPVNLGYNKEEAIVEANRCLQCKKPMCITSCPVEINIPAFIKEIKKGNLKQAFNIIRQNSSLPAVCGRVCPQETQCEGACIMGKKHEPIAIGNLERYVADWARENNIKEEQPNMIPNGHSVAIIGSGPSGLACGGELAKMGYKVTIFEALHKSGGVLSYGIPNFRLPKAEVVDKEIEDIKNLGIEIINDVVIGKSITIDDLFEQGYDAVYIASGAGLAKFMNIEGTQLNGVLSANEFLTRINLMCAYKDDYLTPVNIGKQTIVVGGGNVAMDAARSAKRLGSNVKIVYRRSENEMPARREEAIHAKEEGVEFLTLTNPVKIIGDENGNVKAVELIKMQLSDKDESGRRRPVEVKGSNFIIDCDEIIMALGTDANRLITETTDGLDTTKYGNIITNDNLETSRKYVFAGGDIVSGAATVILAMGAGKKAAKSMNEVFSALNS